MLTSAFPASWVLGGVIIGADILLYATTDKSLGDWIDYYAGKIGLGDEMGLFSEKIKYIIRCKDIMMMILSLYRITLV